MAKDEDKKQLWKVIGVKEKVIYRLRCPVCGTEDDLDKYSTGWENRFAYCIKCKRRFNIDPSLPDGVECPSS